MSSSTDPARFERLERLFEEASRLSAPERASFLDEACAGDAELRRELERMLAVEESADFLEYPSGDTGPPLESPGASGDAHTPFPERIGPYTIVRTLAVGGMGVVYEARQERPARRVALKVLRPGLLGGQATRRFRYEAEVLGRLQDPRIAQVYEAGVHTDAAGETPYFAMEFVDGVDVLRHARAAQLDRRARLELFLEVCAAVQHGHQHGVIHRDIKPSNVLVDAQGRVKLIDFGVARTVGSEDADLTRAGELVGTLAYMAPEQLSGDPAQVDTRTDVHALGLLLYELLCERGPFELGGLSMTEVARVLRDTEPLDPRVLEPSLPRDLAWVLLRALEREPARRYASASELGEDVRRFLAHEPVGAGPPSRLYRARKFVRRNRVAVAAAAVVLAALVAGAGLALAGLLRARAEAAKFASINEVLTNMLVAVRADEDGHDVRVRELLDRAAEQLGLRLAGRPEVELALRRALAESYHGLGLEPEAAEQARIALELGARGGFATATEELELDLLLASALTELGELDEAEARVDRALARAPRREAAAAPTAILLRRLDAWIEAQRGDPERARAALAALSAEAADTLGRDDPATLRVDETLQGLLAKSDTHAAALLGRRLMEARVRLDGPESYAALDRKLALAALLRTRGEYGEARRLYEEALEPLHRVLGPRHPRFLTALHELALLYTETGERDRAATLLEEVAASRRELLPPEHPDRLAVESSLVNLRAKLGEASGVESQRAMFDTRRRIFGPDHPTTLTCMRNLAIGLVGARAFDEAEELVLEYEERTRRALGPEHVESARAADLLGYLHYSRADFAAAAPAFEEAWLGLSRTIGPESNQARRAASNFIATLGRLGRHEEAIPAATELLAVVRRALAPEDPDRVVVHTNLAELHRRAGHTATALEMFAEILDAAREHLPPDHPHRALCAFNLGRTLLENRRADEAEPLLAEAVAEAEYNAAVPPKDLADYRRTLADCLVAQGRRAEALEELALAWEAARRAGGGSGAALVARTAARVLGKLDAEDPVSEWLERAPADLRAAVEAERDAPSGG